MLATTTSAPATIGLTDLGAAAFLIVKGHKLLAVTGSKGRRVLTFSPEASDDLGDYYRGAVAVARDMAQALRDVKAAIARA